MSIHRALKIVCLLSACFVGGNVLSVIIVIHGTFAANESWYLCEGPFIRALRSSYDTLPATCPQKKSAIVSFRWTGHNNAQARILAAKDLGHLILSYPDDEPIHLIGHSHAGNVIAILSKFLKNPFLNQETSDGACSARNPLQPHWNEIVGLPCDDASHALIAASIYDFNVLYHRKIMNVAVRSHGLEGFFHKPLQFQKKIAVAYLLGTPVDSVGYMCDMTVVDRCYALHSLSDCIQTVGGFYGRVFPAQKRLLNLRVYLASGAKKIEGLGHSCLRSPIIGSALLQLPHLIENILKISPEKFDEHPMMILVLFAQGGAPLLLSSLRGADGKFHEEIQKRFSCDNKKPPAVEAGGGLTQFEYDYSDNRSL